MRRRVGLAALTVIATLAGLVLSAPSATAAAAPPYVLHVDSAVQTNPTTVVVTGWGYQLANPSFSVAIEVYFDGHSVKLVRTNVTSAYVNKVRKITGRHQFTVAVTWPRVAKSVTLRAWDARHGWVTYTAGAVRQAVSPGTRVVAEARKFVGRTPYRFGGTSPKTGFDCSGYTQYVYRTMDIAALPRTAEQQRTAAGMRLITKATARPGDLVFYLSGGRAYHVAIYAGGGQQYAAATPQDGIRYQAVWSSAVQYRTDWH